VAFIKMSCALSAVADSTMLSIDDIAEIVSKAHNIPGSIANLYLGSYNKLLHGLFEEDAFVVTFLGAPNHMELAVQNRPYPLPKAVLLLLAADDEELGWDESAPVANTMKKLLMEVDPLDIPTIHGICVSGTRVAFYCYDRQQAVVTPDSEHIRFDLDLKNEDGASRLLEVVEDAKRMCRELMGTLKYN
jgi:hypothetical protein